MSGGIYKITNTISGKYYIGSGRNIVERFWGHKKALIFGTHYNRHFQRSWNKYGEESFKFVVLLYCDKQDLMFYEQRAIDVYQAFNRRYGYNLSPTARSPLGVKHTIETRRKISEAGKGRIGPNKGKSPSVETRRKLSNALKGQLPWNTGKSRSEETKRKISEALKGKTLSGEHKSKISKALVGRVNSEEARQKLSKANIGKKLSEKTKRKISAAVKKQWAEHKKIDPIGPFKTLVKPDLEYDFQEVIG